MWSRDSNCKRPIVIINNKNIINNTNLNNGNFTINQKRVAYLGQGSHQRLIVLHTSSGIHQHHVNALLTSCRTYKTKLTLQEAVFKSNTDDLSILKSSCTRNCGSENIIIFVRTRINH